MPDTETPDDRKMGSHEESGPGGSSGLPHTQIVDDHQISSDAVDASEVEESDYYNSTGKSDENTIFARPVKDKLPEDLKFLSEMRALQMSIFSKSDSITTLILQIENQHNNSNSPDDAKKRKELATSVDEDKCTCLHLAVRNNFSSYH